MTRMRAVLVAMAGSSNRNAVSVDWFGLAVLAVWGAVCAAAAVRWFRFT